MKALPTQLKTYKRTPNFDQTSTPTGLLNAHNTKVGTWGKIIVLEGSLLYRILEPETEEITLTDDRFGVIEPQILHQVQPLGHCVFFVEFYR